MIATDSKKDHGMEVAADLQDPLILVVEDDRGFSELIQRLLRHHGLRTAAAGSGDEALDWLAEHEADLMLLDYSLPDMRADRLIELLDRRNFKVPFIVATGHGSETIAVEMMKRGARDYLVKGLTFFDLLVPQVSRVLAQVEKERRLARAELALRQSEERLRTVIEASNAGIWEWDLTDNVGYWSDEVYELTGISRELCPVDAPTARACIHPDDYPRLSSAIRGLGPGDAIRLEFRLVRPSYDCRWVAMSGKSQVDADGRPLRVAGSILDITDRKRAEIALESRARQQAAVADLGQRALEGEDIARLLEQTVDIIVGTLDVDCARVMELLPDGSFKTRSSAGCPGWEPTAEQLAERFGNTARLGDDPAELPGCCGTDSPAPAGTAECASGLTVMIQGPARIYGVLAALSLNQRTFTQDDRHFLQAVANVLADVIERMRAEDDARQRQSQLAHVMRLNTMGKMVSELAHEINQPLYAIANYAAACREVMKTRGLDIPDELRQWMQQISDQANRAGEILRRLGEFVRKDAPRRAFVSLNTLISNVAGLVEIDARVNEVQLQLELDSQSPLVTIDRVQIEQVIVNLVVNAIEALQSTRPDQRAVHLRTVVDEGRVLVEVEDCGEGVDDEEFQHLFDAFFTTKPTGMGMGLSISRSIIEAHQGELWATRNAGRGMTFKFWLPLGHGDAQECNPIQQYSS